MCILGRASKQGAAELVSDTPLSGITFSENGEGNLEIYKYTEILCSNHIIKRIKSMLQAT